MSAFTSLAPVSEAPFTGQSHELARSTAHHTMLVVVDGPAVECVVALQGSHDGSNWTDIRAFNGTATGLVVTQADGALMNWVRADLRTLVPGNGTVLVSASIASDDGA